METFYSVTNGNQFTMRTVDQMTLNSNQNTILKYEVVSYLLENWIETITKYPETIL